MSTLFSDRIGNAIPSRRCGAGVLAACLLGASASAQLLHRYDFSTDAGDSVGTANGTLKGSATIGGGTLNTSAAAGGLSGGLPQNGVQLPVADTGLNLSTLA